MPWQNFSKPQTIELFSHYFFKVDLFTFDANQLTVAKFMSDRLVDKENASSLAKHFSFDSTKMEYRKYISGKN